MVKEWKYPLLVVSSHTGIVLKAIRDGRGGGPRGAKGTTFDAEMVNAFGFEGNWKPVVGRMYFDWKKEAFMEISEHDYEQRRIHAGS